MRGLWWTNWHQDEIFSEFFAFPLLISSHHSCIFTNVSSSGAGKWACYGPLFHRDIVLPLPSNNSVVITAEGCRKIRQYRSEIIDLYDSRN
jgi:hypothetical protein